MSRRFNFTGRTKILREDVKVTIEPRAGVLLCNVHLKLAGYELRPDASVIVEAERGRVLRLRHDWGKVGLAFAVNGASSEFDITSMGDPEDVRFRVLVVEPETYRLLATAEGIAAHNNEDAQAPQRSLLPIVMQDLYGGVWELEMGKTPTLILDSNLGTKQELKSSPVLFSILPGVVRAILVNLAHELQSTDGDDEAEADENDESGMWLDLGKKWAECPCPSNGNHQEIDEWAQKAATGFCREKKLRHRLASSMTQED